MAVLIQYTFAGQSLAPTTTSTGVTGGTITNGLLKGLSSWPEGFASDPVLDGDPTNGNTTSALAIANAQYGQISISADSGKVLNLTSLTLNASRYDALSSPRGITIRSSADGYSSDLYTGAVSTANPTWTPISVSLTAAQFQGIASISFRIYFWAPNDQGAICVDDITLNGAVAVSSANINTVPAIANASAPSPVLHAGANVAATPASATASAPAPIVAGNQSATVSAVAAAATASAPSPTVTSSLISTLITNRTLSDVSYYKAQFARIVNNGWGSLSSAEQAEWMSASLKGGYWHTDLNRVGAAIQYIAGQLNTYGYPITVTARTDWAASDNLRSDDMQAYLTDITNIKNRFYGLTPLPVTMDYTGFADWNNIEILMIEIEANINHMISVFRPSGTFYAGE